MGKKKQPIYKVVAADARSPRDGKILEAIGLYNPLTNPHTININEERALYWLSVGAQPTDTVKSLLTQKGTILKKELKDRGLSDENIESEMSNWEKLREAKLKSSVGKKKISKKAAAKKAEVKTEKVETTTEKVEAAPVAEPKTEEVETTPVAETKEELKAEKPEIKEDKNNESTAEVKGNTSEEETKKKEV